MSETTSGHSRCEDAFQFPLCISVSLLIRSIKTHVNARCERGLRLCACTLLEGVRFHHTIHEVITKKEVSTHRRGGGGGGEGVSITSSLICT